VLDKKMDKDSTAVVVFLGNLYKKESTQKWHSECTAIVSNGCSGGGRHAAKMIPSWWCRKYRSGHVNTVLELYNNCPIIFAEH
jgi:hypothetical protein